MYTLRFPIQTPIAFASAGQFVAKNNPVHPHRILDSAVLLLGLDGTYPIAQDGREYLLESNTFMVLFPNHAHGGYAPATDPQSHFWCHFYLPLDALHPVTDRCDLQAATNRGFCVLPEFGRISHTEKYRMLFRQLIDASQNLYQDKAAQARICDAYITVIVQELSQECLRQEPRGSASAVVEKIREYLRLHACTEPICITELAARYHYNASYLTELFRAETGMTLVAYLNSVRMERARSLLLNTDATVESIAKQCGFGDTKYFMKTFKRINSVTPSEFRRSYTRLHENNR